MESILLKVEYVLCIYLKFRLMALVYLCSKGKQITQVNDLLFSWCHWIPSLVLIVIV